MEQWKKHKGFIIVTSLITIIPMMAGIILWNKLPDSMATHFYFDNTPNGWSSKLFSVFYLSLGHISSVRFSHLQIQNGRESAISSLS